MALKIKWSLQAEKGLDKVLAYLEEEWTKSEILKLEENLQSTLNLIVKNPELFPTTDKYKNLHKALVDKNNYLIYKVNNENKRVEIINFRGTKQKPKY